MIAKSGSDQGSTFACELNPADPSIGGLLFSGDESFSNKAIDGDTNGPGSEPDFGTDGVDGEGALVQQRFQNAEIGIAEAGSGDAFLGVRHKRLEGFHQNQPNMNAGMILPGSNFFAWHLGLT